MLVHRGLPGAVGFGGAGSGPTPSRHGATRSGLVASRAERRAPRAADEVAGAFDDAKRARAGRRAVRPDQRGEPALALAITSVGRCCG